MDFKKLIVNRESCRNYTGEQISLDDLQLIVEAGRLSPSACNSQPWDFYIVKGEKLEGMKKAVRFFGSNAFAEKASAFIAIVGEKPNYPERVGRAIYGRDFSENDIGMTAVSMSYQATDLGLGSCIIGAFNENVAKDVLGLSNDKRHVKLVLVVGKPENIPVREKKRKDINTVAHYVD